MFSPPLPSFNPDPTASSKPEARILQESDTSFNVVVLEATADPPSTGSLGSELTKGSWDVVSRVRGKVTVFILTKSHDPLSMEYSLFLPHKFRDVRVQGVQFQDSWFGARAEGCEVKGFLYARIHATHWVELNGWVVEVVTWCSLQS